LRRRARPRSTSRSESLAGKLHRSALLTFAASGPGQDKREHEFQAAVARRSAPGRGYSRSVARKRGGCCIAAPHAHAPGQRRVLAGACTARGLPGVARSPADPKRRLVREEVGRRGGGNQSPNRSCVHEKSPGRLVRLRVRGVKCTSLGCRRPDPRLRASPSSLRPYPSATHSTPVDLSAFGSQPQGRLRTSSSQRRR